MAACHRRIGGEIKVKMDKYFVEVTVRIKEDGIDWDAPEGEAVLKFELPHTETGVLVETLKNASRTIMVAAVNDLERAIMEAQAEDELMAEILKDAPKPDADAEEVDDG